MRIVLTWVFGIVTLGLLLWGLFGDVCLVHSMKPGGSEMEVRGVEMTERATVDGVILKEGRLWDATSLTPRSMSVSDCPT